MQSELPRVAHMTHTIKAEFQRSPLPVSVVVAKTNAGPGRHLQGSAS